MIQVPLQHLDTPLKIAGDIGSFSVILATLMAALPSMTALLAFLWTLIRLYETQTVQRLLHMRCKNKKCKNVYCKQYKGGKK